MENLEQDEEPNLAFEFAANRQKIVRVEIRKGNHDLGSQREPEAVTLEDEEEAAITNQEMGAQEEV